MVSRDKTDEKKHKQPKKKKKAQTN